MRVSRLLFHTRLTVGSTTTSGTSGTSTISGVSGRPVIKPIDNSPIFKFPRNSSDVLSLWGNQPAKAISMYKLAEYKDDPTTLAFLLREQLCVRFAHRARLLQILSNWSSGKNKDIEYMRNSYQYSFSVLLSASPGGLNGHESFRRLMKVLKERHHTCTNRVVRGFREMESTSGLTPQQISYLADGFFASRIATNMLISHWLFLVNQKEGHSKVIDSGEHGVPQSPLSYNMLANVASTFGNLEEALQRMNGQACRSAAKLWGPHGVLHPCCSTVDVCRVAIRDVQHLCVGHYQIQPYIFLHGRHAPDLPMVPRFLYFIVLELLKNSVKASFDNKVPDLATEPTISIDVSLDQVQGRQGVGIRVRDSAKGLGMNYKRAGLFFASSESPTDDVGRDVREVENVDEALDEVPRHLHLLNGDDPLAGHGCGIPLASLYARAMGGHLELLPAHRHGVSAYVFIPDLAPEKHVFEEGPLVGGVQAMLSREFEKVKRMPGLEEMRRKVQEDTL